MLHQYISRLRMFGATEKPGHIMVSNSAFLMANTFVGSAFGFLFWLLAAHSYTPNQVGLGAAYISALTFLSTLAELGLSTVLIRFAPSMKGNQITFINSVLSTVVTSTLLVCAIFALGTPLWSPEMKEIARPSWPFGAFVATGVLAGAGLLLDRVCVAFEATYLMFLRNLVANVLRVVLIVSVCRYFGAGGLVLALGGGAAASFILSAAVFLPRAVPGYRMRPAFDWRILEGKVRYSLGNHLASLLWSAPALVYPLVIINLLGARANAHFYVSWMVANLLFIVPTSIFTSAFARAANAGYLDDPSFWRTMRFSLLGLLVPAAGLSAIAPFVLRAFGDGYGSDGRSLFVLLTLSVFPYTFNTAIIMYHRIKLNTGQLIAVAGLITLLCLASSIALGSRYALTGIGVGWLSGQVIGVGFALLSRRRVARTAMRGELISPSEDLAHA